jgi:hypothetical protein
MFHLAGNAARKSGGVELLDARDAILALANSLPSLLRANAKRAHQPHSGDNYSARKYWLQEAYFFFLLSM